MKQQSLGRVSSVLRQWKPMTCDSRIDHVVFSVKGSQSGFSRAACRQVVQSGDGGGDGGGGGRPSQKEQAEQSGETVQV